LKRNRRKTAYQPSEIEYILGIPFLNGSVEQAVSKVRDGGLFVVPAAPALANLPFDKSYHEALTNADFAMADSMYMVIWWAIIKRKLIKRISGLCFLKKFLKLKELQKKNSMFLVNPNEDEACKNRLWIIQQRILISEDFSYTAPMYGELVKDEYLLKVLRVAKPKYILINIGGGTQEKLGFYLKQNLDYKPGIICTGAAIAFLTGVQARIPTLIDTVGFGWFMRCIFKPKFYIPRYWKAFKLAKLLIKYGKNPVRIY